MRNRPIMHFRSLFVVCAQIHLHLAFNSFRERCSNVYLLLYASFALKKTYDYVQEFRVYHKTKLLGNAFHSLGVQQLEKICLHKTRD